MSDTAKVITLKSRKPTRHRAEHYDKRSEAYQLEITERELKRLRKFVEVEGAAEIAHSLDMSEGTLMKVCAGFLEHCRLSTRQKVREFFGAWRE
jgi:hypothetical protein